MDRHRTRFLAGLSARLDDDRARRDSDEDAPPTWRRHGDPGRELIPTLPGPRDAAAEHEAAGPAEQDRPSPPEAGAPHGPEERPATIEALDRRAPDHASGAAMPRPDSDPGPRPHAEPRPETTSWSETQPWSETGMRQALRDAIASVRRVSHHEMDELPPPRSYHAVYDEPPLDEELPPTPLDRAGPIAEDEQAFTQDPPFDDAAPEEPPFDPRFEKVALEPPSEWRGPDDDWQAPEDAWRVPDDDWLAQDDAWRSRGEGPQLEDWARHDEPTVEDWAEHEAPSEGRRAEVPRFGDEEAAARHGFDDGWADERPSFEDDRLPEEPAFEDGEPEFPSANRPRQDERWLDEPDRQDAFADHLAEASPRFAHEAAEASAAAGHDRADESSALELWDEPQDRWGATQRRSLHLAALVIAIVFVVLVGLGFGVLSGGQELKRLAAAVGWPLGAQETSSATPDASSAPGGGARTRGAEAAQQSSDLVTVRVAPLPATPATERPAEPATESSARTPEATASVPEPSSGGTDGAASPTAGPAGPAAGSAGGERALEPTTDPVRLVRERSADPTADAAIAVRQQAPEPASSTAPLPPPPKPRLSAAAEPAPTPERIDRAVDAAAAAVLEARGAGGPFEPIMVKTAVSGPRVFVHYIGGAPGGAATALHLVRQLKASGLAAEGREVDFAIPRDSIRYFFDSDRDAAEALGERLKGELPGDGQVAILDFTHYRPRPREGHLEVWLGR